MPKVIQMVGRRFGRLLVLREVGRSSNGDKTYLCRCDCGNEAVLARTRAAKTYHLPVIEEFEEETKMNKVYKGRRYNTDSATLVAFTDDVQLYRKRTGEYFFALPRSEEIRPTDLEDARKFASEHLDPDKFEEAFGPANDAKTSLNLVITVDSKRKLQSLAQSFDCSVSAVVETLVNQYKRNK